MAIHKGARVSSATQLLNEEGDIGSGLRRPKNLEVRVETRVEKILFDRKTAIGVQVEGGRKCKILSPEISINFGEGIQLT